MESPSIELALLQAKLEYLQGQVTGLQAAVRGLVCAHPEPALAGRIVQLALEETHANALASASATDVALLGLERSPSQLLPNRAQVATAAHVGVISDTASLVSTAKCSDKEKRA